MRKRILAGSLGLVVAFFATELTLRLTQPHVDLVDASGNRAGSHPMADWAHVDAFCAYRGIPGSYLHTDGKKTINSDGFISTPEIAHEKEPGTLRVAFLGGSSTACSVPVLSDEETWPWQVARSLDAELSGHKVDFLNGALPGYSTFESYGRLWSRLRFYRPDVVVVYHGWNEMYYFKDPAWLHRRHVNADGDWNFERPMIRKPIRPRAMDKWISWSQLLVRVRRRFFSEPLAGEVGKDREEISENFDPRAVDIFRENIRLLVAAQKALGFKLFVVKQATLVTDRGDADKTSYRYHGFSYQGHVRAFDAIYTVIDEEVPAGQVLDVTHLSGDPRLLIDHIHLSAAGCREVATSLSTQLLRHLRP